MVSFVRACLAFVAFWLVPSICLAQGLEFEDDFGDGELHSIWKTKSNGCVLEEVDGGLRIHGVVAEGGWGKENIAKIDLITNGGDFDVSVDFRVPKFAAKGDRLVYLGGFSQPARAVAVLYIVGVGYRVQTWEPWDLEGRLRPFGDEDQEFHRMRLVLDAASKTATGYVDGQEIGSTEVQEIGNLAIYLMASTQTQGAEIDVRFDNFSGSFPAAEPTAAPESQVPPTVEPPQESPPSTCIVCDPTCARRQQVRPLFQHRRLLRTRCRCDCVLRRPR